MKISKSLFLAFAGLGLFACSNEDVADNGGVQGEAIVNVKISTDESRSLANSTTGTGVKQVEIQTLTLSLSASVGSKSVTFPIRTVEDAKEAGLEGEAYDELSDVYFSKLPLAQANEYHFTGVYQPTSLSVSVNGGKSANYQLTEVYNTGLAAKMFDEVTIGADMYDAATKTYTVVLEPEHRTALLEFSEIKHVDEDQSLCWFKTIKFDGLFLNNVQKTENDENSYLTNVSNWEEAKVGAPTFDVAEGNMQFHQLGAIWPAEDGKCYAYNVFPSSGNNMPVLTLCFSNISLQDYAGEWVGEKDENGYFGYATVNKYVDQNGAEITEFAPGYVYRFTGLSVPDKAIGSTIEGGGSSIVVASVVVLPWTIVDGTVEWNE